MVGIVAAATRGSLRALSARLEDWRAGPDEVEAALCAAAERGHVAAVAAIIANPQQLHIRPDAFARALHRVATAPAPGSGSAEVVRQLVARVDDTGQLAYCLLAAVESGATAVVDALVTDTRMDLRAWDGLLPTVLAFCGHAEVAARLLPAAGKTADDVARAMVEHGRVGVADAVFDAAA
jgi:hypothetical protein